MSFLERLKSARMVRVVVVYLGASWVVIEAADLLQEALTLPAWVVPVTIILLLVGLVVVSATAWVQGLPSTERREAAGEVPTDWQIDWSDLARSLRKGRLPHLTWGRAILGGVVAFLALFGLAALLVPSVSGPDLRPRELAAAEAGPGLAVLPFRVTSEELGTWREGMVDLLSRNLDGVGGLRALDSRTVLARWRETVGSGEADLATALEAARRAGARWALVGTVVEVGSRVRVTADVHEVATGARVEGVRAEGPADSLLSLVDALSVDVARVVLEEGNPDLTALKVSSITTESPEALSAFLEGEAAYRRQRFEAALAAYGRAVEIDSAFALAHFRIASARGWSSIPGVGEARGRAFAHRDRLPAREALIVEAEFLARRGALHAGVDLLRQGLRRYPDDPELWYQFGDVSLHWGGQLGVSPEAAAESLERAVELDPGFAPYQIHLVELALAQGDSAEAARRLAAERELGGDGWFPRVHQLMFEYVYGSERDRERVLESLDATAEDELLWRTSVWTLNGERSGELLGFWRHVCQEMREREILNPARAYQCFSALFASGRIEDALDLAGFVRSYSGLGSGPALLAALALRQTALGRGVEAPPVELRDVRLEPDLQPPALFMLAMILRQTGNISAADSAIALLDAATARSESEGDTLSARLIHGLGEGARGLRAAAGGRADAALDYLARSERLLAGSTGPEEAMWTIVLWPLAELLTDRGEHREALEHYERLERSYFASPALARRIEIHDRLGETDRADSLRRQFLRLWADADPGHPLLAEVRQGLPPG